MKYEIQSALIFDVVGKEVGGVDHRFLGCLKGLRLDIFQQVSNELVEAESKNEDDKKERDPGKTHILFNSKF